MFTRILAFTMACLMAVMPVSAKADLGAVMDSLAGGAVANVNQPGRFQSQARTSVVLGGFEMRLAPTKNTPTLVSFTPPKFDAGCAGVSAFFGGFSFISGKEFEQLLKNISSGVALGFVGHLALKTLCPQCEAVVQLMQRLNQIASMAAKDACKYGAALAESFMNSSSGASPSTDGKCGAAASGGSDRGVVSDMLAGLNSLCKSVEKMNEQLNENVIEKMKAWAAAGVPEAKQAEQAALLRLQGGMGNRTWVLSGVFFKPETPGHEKPRQLMLNLLGTTIYPDANNGRGTCSSEGSYGEKGEIYCKPNLKAEEVMELFMCGVEKYKPSGAAPSVTKACENTVGFKAAELAKKKLYECNETRECMHLEAKDFKDSTILNGYVGISYQVSLTLREAVRRVIKNERLWDGGSSDAEGKKIVALIQAAPYPIYHAINAAAVYPAASADILDSLTMLISEQMAMAYFTEFFRLAGRSTGPTDLTEPMVRNFSDGMKAFSDRVEALKQKTATNLAVQEGITHSIRTLNQAIQRQVMTEELFGSNQFGKGLSSLVSGGAGAGTRTQLADNE